MQPYNTIHYHPKPGNTHLCSRAHQSLKPLHRRAPLNNERTGKKPKINGLLDQLIKSAEGETNTQTQVCCLFFVVWLPLRLFQIFCQKFASQNRALTTVANESQPIFVICINFCPILISPLSGKISDSSSRKRPRRGRRSVEKLHLFHISLRWDVIAAYERPHLPFLSLIKARTGRRLDPRRWLKSCASTRQIPKFLLEKEIETVKKGLQYMFRINSANSLFKKACGQ